MYDHQIKKPFQFTNDKGHIFHTRLKILSSKRHTHLKDLDKCPHVESADTKRESKYSWHNYEDKQKSQPHSDRDAETPGELVGSKKCKPSHAAQCWKRVGKRLHNSETCSFRTGLPFCWKPLCLKPTLNYTSGLAHCLHLRKTAHDIRIGHKE